MIDQIYRKYFQKSYTFLYPLLEIKKTMNIKPTETFMFWKHLDGPKIICIYNSAQKNWDNFEQTLLNHGLLETFVQVSPDTKAFVFNLDSLEEDFNHILKGKYSKISSISKRIIMEYYGIGTPTSVYIESFLFPQKYFEQYSKILKVDKELLIEVGELCEKINVEKETCPYAISQEVLQYGEFIIKA
jgi:hypothetical protein